MSDEKRSAESIKLPRWYVTKTLLGCGPDSDVNRRILYHDNREVVTFNYRMAEWHPDDDQALHALADYLNRLEESAHAK